VEFADGRRRWLARLFAQPIDFGLFKLDILSSANNFYFFGCSVLPWWSAPWDSFLRSPFGRP